eukprot:TRINITY_DN7956_c0_g3_i2.p1 TRINITY_DN7956_c0_g3~~TRINITY_DN7956_c0_g3_i2.p1  ORF type:complete len:285 (-),score=121.73 TRINITY_DN7956_c0_g3_i2:8-862(-)
MSKVNMAVMKPWISDKVTEVLGFEDDILIGYFFELLTQNNPDPRKIQINLTEFLGGSDTSALVTEIWKMLLSAQQNVGGIPQQLLDAKKQQIRANQAENERVTSELAKKREREEEERKENSLKSVENKGENPKREEREIDRRREERSDNHRRSSREEYKSDRSDRDYHRGDRDRDYHHRSSRNERDRDYYHRDSYRSSRDERGDRDYHRSDTERWEYSHRDRDDYRESRGDRDYRRDDKEERGREERSEKRRRHEALEESPVREENTEKLQQLREQAILSMKRE